MPVDSLPWQVNGGAATPWKGGKRERDETYKTNGGNKASPASHRESLGKLLLFKFGRFEGSPVTSGTREGTSLANQFFFCLSWFDFRDGMDCAKIRRAYLRTHEVIIAI